jgi:ribosome-associated toxin RatA of RatAB toxin-antitoxin module
MPLRFPLPVVRSVTAALAAVIVWQPTAVLAASPAAPVTPPPYPPVTMYVNQLTPYLEQKLDKGEIVVLLKQRHPLYDLDVYGNVEGTVDQVWNAVTSYDHYDEFLPLVTEAYLRKRQNNLAYQYIRMNPPWPFTEKWMVNAHKEDKARGMLTWEQAEGNVRFERGFWAVKAVGPNKTRLQYHLTVDPWMDNMPGWVVDMVTKGIMPNVIKGARKRVKQDQQAKK